MTEEHKQFDLPEPGSPGQMSPDDWISSSNTLRTHKDLIVKSFFFVNDTEAYLGGGQRFNRIGIRGATYSISTTDYLVGVTSLATAPTIGLPRPSLVGNGKTLIIKDEAGGAGTTTITVRSEGEKTIDGATSATITTNYGKKGFYTDGANWFTHI